MGLNNIGAHVDMPACSMVCLCSLWGVCFTMSDKSINEKIIEGLENGDILLADPGVTVETITIAEYA